MSCDACIVVGMCPVCERIVCWAHHDAVEANLAGPIERLRQQMPPDPLFEPRCPDPG